MQPLVTGADLSHVAWLESRGAAWSDAAGRQRDPFELCREAGLGMARLRVYAGDPAAAAANPFDREPLLPRLVALARRAKRAGLQVMLDLHYAESWADPQHQPPPPEWQGLDAERLGAALAEHGATVLRALRDAGAWPAMVQVGNEITNGMVWPHGRVDPALADAAAWDRFTGLLHAAVDGLRSVRGPLRPELVLHLDRGGDWASTLAVVDRLEERRVPWDVLGQSYYPFWHGTVQALADCLARSAGRWRRPVMLVETAAHHGPSPGEGDCAFERSPQGQVELVRAAAAALRAVPDGLGRGILWWGAEYAPAELLPDPRLNARACFDRQGRALPVLYELGRCAA